MKKKYQLLIDGSLIAETETDSEFGGMQLMAYSVLKHFDAQPPNLDTSLVEIQVDGQTVEKYAAKYDFDAEKWTEAFRIF